MKIRTRNQYGSGYISRKKALRAIHRGIAYIESDDHGEVLVFGPRPRPMCHVQHHDRPRQIALPPVASTAPWEHCWRTAEAAVAWPYIHDEHSGRA